MPYPSSYLYVVHQFRILGTDEIAQTGTKFGFATYDAASAIENIEAADLALLMQQADALYANEEFGPADYLRYDGVRVAAVGADGHELTDPITADGSAYSLQGTFSGVPPQCSVVLSLRSGSGFGDANYGRMFLPYCKPSLSGSSPYIPAADAAAMAEAGAFFISSCNEILTDATGTPTLAGIYSPKGAGTRKPVAQVGVDNVIDTQRRRYNRLNNAYSFAVVA